MMKAFHGQSHVRHVSHMSVLAVRSFLHALFRNRFTLGNSKRAVQPTFPKDGGERDKGMDYASVRPLPLLLKVNKF